MGEAQQTFPWRCSSRVALCASLTLWLPLSANAQGSGPAPGMEVLLWAFMAAAALFVLVVSTVLFLVGKKALFKDRQASLLEKLALFAASILVSCAAGVMIMVIFDIR